MGGVATPAWAHATLLSSDPADGTSVPTGPASITLRFSEHVLVDTDAVRVVAGSGNRVDTADAHTVGAGDTVVAGLRGGLATGTYLVSWHVISADTHPVSGGFSFGVGVTPSAYSAAGGGVSGLDVLGAAGRTFVYAGLVLAVGVGAFLAAVWPAGRARRRYRRLPGWGLVLLATGTVVEFLVQGAAGVGGGLGALTRPSLVADTADSYLGHLLALRLLLVVMAAIALRAQTWASLTRPELALLGVGLAGTVALAGHAHSGSDQLLAGASWTLHVLAMAVWLGGLTVLVAATWRRDPDPSTDQTLTAAMPRCSRLAQAAVVVLLVTGGSQAWREVRSLDAVAPTTYGNLLVVKVAMFSVRVRQLRVAALPLHRRRRRRLCAARDL
jgi:copper transport protein